MHTGSESAAAVPPVDGPTSSRKRRILAAVLSATVPGAGHLCLNKNGKAIGFLLTFAALGLLYWPVRLPKFYWGLIGLFWATMILCAVAAWNALRTPSKLVLVGSRRWFLLLFPIALLTSTVHTNWLLRAAGFGVYGMPSVSMEPTIMVGDKLIGDLRRYQDAKPQPGEIILFHRDGAVSLKRVIAVGGSTIEGQGGVILRDGKLLEESFVQHVGTSTNWANDFGPKQIPPGELFVMGDNRDRSLDSRSPDFGRLREQDVIGQGLYIVRPLSERNGFDLR